MPRSGKLLGIGARSCVVACTLLVCGASLALAEQDDRDLQEARAKLEADLRERLDADSARVEPVTITHPTPQTMLVELQLGHRAATLQLARHSIRSPGYQIMIADPTTGQLVTVPPPPVRTYRGNAQDEPDSHVRASVRDGRLWAQVQLAGDRFAIEPLTTLDPTAESDLYVVYRGGQAFGRGGFACGTTDLARLPFDIDAAQPRAAGTGLEIAEIAIDADFDFFLLNGGNLDATVFDVENVMNGVAGVYEVANIGITYEITTIVVRTEDGTYSFTAPSNLLNQFGNRWSSPPESNIHRDVAHLFTGKNLDGSIIGIASLGVVCNDNSGYGLSQSRFTGNFNSRVALTAHEIGHNWSAQHCDSDSDCRIMCSGLGGCTGISPLTFGSQAVSSINFFQLLAPCLQPLASPNTLPFIDFFPDPQLDMAKWSSNLGGQVVSFAAAEPSPPFAVQLNTAGIGEFRDDDLRTNFILADGASNLTLAYSTQTLGVDAGESLIVEYRNDNLQWVEINRVVSDGIDQTTFTRHEHLLPPDAYHDKLRIRFRTDVDTITDRWYIDDVVVADQFAPLISAQPADQSACVGETTQLTFGALGSSPLTFQWQKGGEDIPGADQQTLTIDSVVPGDAGSYDCVVENGLGQITTLSATLSVMTDADCDDGLFCNGVESCSAGSCLSALNPCDDPGAPFCIEDSDRCVQCATDGICSDGDVCNGVEVCIDGFCESAPNAPAGTACGSHSNNVCTAPDTCDGLGSCQPNHADDGTDCEDALFCNGHSTCQQGVCAPGPDPCPGQQCVEDSQECIAPAQMNCVLSNQVAGPGQRIAMDLFVNNVVDLRGYQIKLAISKTLGEGALTVPCGDGGVQIDESRDDYVFSGAGQAFTVEFCSQLVANANLVSGGVDVNGAPAYLGTYTFDVSSDAIDSVFELTVLPPGVQEGTLLLNSDLNVITTDLPTCQVTIGDCVEFAYGDVNHDNTINIFDIFCVLDGFIDVFDHCTLQQVDIASPDSCDPDGTVDIFDIFGVLDAFQGAAKCPDPCVVP